MRTDRGSATAETAVALPGLLAVLAACVWVLTLVGTTLRCADAARAAARAAARHETPEAVAAAARSAAGRPVDVSTTAAPGPGSGSGVVTVRVATRLAPPLPFLRRVLPPVTVRQAATAQVEPEVP
jgi:Flp pilus assembly protein TadG